MNHFHRYFPLMRFEKKKGLAIFIHIRIGYIMINSFRKQKRKEKKIN